MQTHIARWGNSLALRIPKPVADRLGLGEGGVVELSVDDGQLVVRPRPAEPRLDELLAAITAENLPAGFDDAPVGREAL
jgi:antitoxin MazE